MTVKDAFFLGRIDKGAITHILKPDVFFDDHVFFDDRVPDLQHKSLSTPSVRVPFGVVNEEQWHPATNMPSRAARTFDY